MRRLIFVLTIIVSVTTSLRAGQGPGAVQAPNLTIRVFGGLLGQIEGFCEPPGGTYDWGRALTADEQCDPSNGSRGSAWLGGALGVRGTLSALHPGSSDLLVVAGNNQPASFGSNVWGHIAALNPHAVGLGRADFTRLLRGATASGRVMRDWVRNSAALPLLASNVIVRRTASDLNTVKSGGVELHLPDNASVGWLTSVKIDMPALKAPTVTLEEYIGNSPTGPTTTVPATFKEGESGQDRTVEFKQPLRPARWYRLKIGDQGKERAAFTFVTDSALTPRADRGGYPVVFDASRSLLTVAMVDPEARALAANPVWKWTEGDGDYEMVFLDPVKALRTLIDASQRDGDPPRTVMLISGLDDEDTASLLEDYPEIRFVILPPESGLIGRASAIGRHPANAGGDATRYSGDLGFSAVIDPYYPQATRVMVRPEWVGETLLTITANLSTPSMGVEATIRNAAARVDLVHGAKLVSRTIGNEVHYSAELGTQRVDVAAAAVYLACPPRVPDACAHFRALWMNPDDLAAAMGDALRLRLHTDLAIIPKDLIDEDYANYISNRLGSQQTDWISRFILERLVWDSRRIVKAYVSGEALAGKLKAALKADDTACVTGLGSRCSSSVDTDHPERLEINGRRLAPALFYAVAMPDVLAEALELPHNDDVGVDLVEAVHQYLLASSWLPLRNQPGDSVGTRLDTARQGGWKGYFAAHKLDLGLALITPKDPTGATDVRKNLGLSFSGAEESRTLSVSTNTDWGIIDAPRFAVRMPSTVDYTRRRTPDKTSFDSDQFFVGIRLDWKFHNARPFVGYFREGQIHDHPTSLTASRSLEETRDGFKQKESADFSTSYVAQKRQYHYWAVGIDFVPLKSFPLVPQVTATLRKLGLQWTRGNETNVPTGLSIGTVPQNLDDLISKGDDKLLNDYFEANPATFSQAVEFAVKTGTLPARRVQGDVDGEIAWKPRDKTYTGTLAIRYRHYTSADLVSSFQLAREFKFEAGLGIPLWWRLKLAPAYTYERARIKADVNNVFRYSKWDIKVSLPIVLRYGLGRLIR